MVKTGSNKKSLARYNPNRIIGVGATALQNSFTGGSLVSAPGPTFSITRATTSYTQDFEGLLKPINSGEARFWKLRRVANLLISTAATTGNYSIAGGTGTKTVIVGAGPNGEDVVEITTTSTNVTIDVSTVSGVGSPGIASISAQLVSGSGAFSINDNIDTVSVTATTSWQRFVNSTPTTAGTDARVRLNIPNNGATIRFCNPQSEVVVGQAIQNPSEYVSKGVLSSPYYGAGVDGVRYFNTANGNTVSSNVVTEATGAPLGTLASAGMSVFGSATNLLTRSEEFDNAAWTKLASTATADTTVAPDGLTTADTIKEDGTSNQHYVSQSTSVSAGTAYTLRVRIKRGAGTRNITIAIAGGSGNAIATFDGATGALLNSAASTYTGLSTKTASVAGGFFELSVRATVVTDATVSSFIALNNGSTATVASYAGDNASTLICWGAQLTATDDAPYIKTTTVTVTTNADVITASGSGVINQTEGTLYAKWLGVNASSRGLLELDDGTTNEQVVLNQGATALMAWAIRTGGASVANSNTASGNVGAANKGAVRYRLNDANGAGNGTLTSADTSCTMPTTTTFRVGGAPAAGSETNGVIQEVRYYAIGQTDAQLQALTT